MSYNSSILKKSQEIFSAAVSNLDNEALDMDNDEDSDEDSDMENVELPKNVKVILMEEELIEKVELMKYYIAEGNHGKIF